MIDRSTLPYEKNVQEVKEMVKIAHAAGISVEAELGHVGQGSNYDIDGKTALTDVAEAVRFIEETGVDALLHVSQISKDHIEKPADALKVNDEVTAKVVDFNEADKKISLSVKALLAPEAEESKEDADVVPVDIEAVAAEQE